MATPDRTFILPHGKDIEKGLKRYVGTSRQKCINKWNNNQKR